MVINNMHPHFQISLILFNLTYIKPHFQPDTPAIGKTDQKIPISVSKILATNVAFFLRKCKNKFPQKFYDVQKRRFVFAGIL